MSTIDIVERLRDDKYDCREEAADEIERLRADNTRLRARRDELFSANAALSKDSTRLSGVKPVTPEQWLESQKHAQEAGMSGLAKAFLEQMMNSPSRI